MKRSAVRLLLLAGAVLCNSQAQSVQQGTASDSLGEDRVPELAGDCPTPSSRLLSKCPCMPARPEFGHKRHSAADSS